MGRGAFHTTVVFNDYLLIAETQAALILEGMKLIAQQVKLDAKSRVREDTSTLKKSIFIRNIEGAIYELYSNVEYAVYQEFGTRKLTVEGKGEGAQFNPFMFPAAMGAKPRIDAMVAAVLTQGFKH